MENDEMEPMMGMEDAPADNMDAKPEEKAASESKPEEDKPKESGVKMPAMPKIKNPLDSEPYAPSDQTARDTYRLSPCCCCLCACSHDRVGDASCFGCFPIRCGVIFIGMFIFFLAIILLTSTFFGLLNEYTPWWFTFVTLLLLTPLIVSASIAVYFFAKDKRSTRGKLRGAAIMSVISIFLWMVWQLIFYLAIYKRDTVYSGYGHANDESNYIKSGKKQFIFTFLAEGFVLIGFLGYFIAVISQYVTLMNAPHDKKDREAAREAKAAEPAADDK